MADRMQGIVRYAREILSELDKLLTDDITVSLVIPPDAKSVPAYQNIKIVPVGTHTGILWEQFDFGNYVRKHKEATLINFCNVTPFGVQPGITVVHDIMYKVKPEYYVSLRNKISRLWHVLQYRYIFSHEKSIITVSEFSKGEIEKYYSAARGKIHVIPNGWQHVLRVSDDENWQKKWPDLKPRQFFFSLSTMAKNKNGEWILKAAEKNPDEIFAMAGSSYEKLSMPVPANVRLLGFVTDEEVHSLMKNCKAFIHPSFYEGFGIPPLEALALGAQVISSNTSSLPEVLENSVHYIDPSVPEVDLNTVLNEITDRPSTALEKFSWQKSAEKLNQNLEFIE